MFGATMGGPLVSYWLKVADKHGFALDQATVVPDHIHMLIRTTPKLSVEQVALSLMNNGQYFVAKHFPGALLEANIDQLWQIIGLCRYLWAADHCSVEGFPKRRGAQQTMSA